MAWNPSGQNFESVVILADDIVDPVICLVKNLQRFNR